MDINDNNNIYIYIYISSNIMDQYLNLVTFHFKKKDSVNI